jgi:hypothetical protein
MRQCDNLLPSGLIRHVGNYRCSTTTERRNVSSDGRSIGDVSEYYRSPFSC